MTAAPAQMDPRIRARRLAVHREAGRRRMRVLLLVAALFVAGGAVYLVTVSPLLDLDHVRVAGVEQLTAGDVVDASGLRTGEPLLWLDTARARASVEELAWVASAKVTRDLPGTVRIVVDEHEALAYAHAADGALALFAADGHVVATVDGPPPAGAVELVGVRRVPGPGGFVSPPGAAALVRDLPGPLGSRVRAVDLSGDGVALVLDTGTVELGQLDDVAAKAAAALAVLDRIGGEPFGFLDVRVPQHPVVRATPRR
jgi:cell division protein FtsQ